MNTHKPVLGVCMDMCPIVERKWREREKLLHFFEVVDYTENEKKPLADSGKVIKQFRRSAAGQSQQTAEELRPPHILHETMNYLIDKIISRTDVPWCTVYDFVNDRIQAIRQDLTIQMAEDNHTVQILEKCVKFYVTAFYMLCEEPLSIFDPYLNNKQLQECLKRLLVLYSKNTLVTKQQEEMLSIYCLYNLDSTEALQYVLDVTRNLKLQSVLKDAINICKANMCRNFSYVLKRMQKLPIILLYCILQHIQKIRYTALQVMCTAYSSKLCRFPIKKLSHWLCYNSCEEVKYICIYYGIKVENNFIHFQKGDFDKCAKIPSTVQEHFIKEQMGNISISVLINSSTKTNITS